MSERRYQWGDKVWVKHKSGCVHPGFITSELNDTYCWVSFMHSSGVGSASYPLRDISPRDDDKPKTWRLPQEGDTIRVTDKFCQTYGRELLITRVLWNTAYPIHAGGGLYDLSAIELVRLHDDPARADHVPDAGEKIEEPAFDPVAKARHYNVHPSGVECITIVEHFDFVIGNIIKYAWRAGLKDPKKRLEDLRKCLYYASRAVSREETRNAVD